MKEGANRFVAFDIHQNYCMGCAVDDQQQIVLQPRKVEVQALGGIAQLDAGKFRMGAGGRKKLPKPLKAGRVRRTKRTTER